MQQLSRKINDQTQRNKNNINLLRIKHKTNKLMKIISKLSGKHERLSENYKLSMTTIKENIGKIKLMTIFWGLYEKVPQKIIQMPKIHSISNTHLGHYG